MAISSQCYLTHIQNVFKISLSVSATLMFFSAISNCFLLVNLHLSGKDHEGLTRFAGHLVKAGH